MEPNRQPLPIELLILTGFLGSGKTTLLCSYLHSPEASETALIVNEIGEIDLDGAILSSASGKVPMALLSNGCVCCTAGEDLPGTIAMLIEDRLAQGNALSRIVLETTGLAIPGPLLRSLVPLADHLKVHVVSTFDLESGDRTLPLPEAAAQLAGAQRIVLTKPDSITAMSEPEARLLLAGVNAFADIVSCADPLERALEALAPPASTLDRMARRVAEEAGQPANEPQAGEIEPPSTHSDIGTFLCRFDRAIGHHELCVWLDNLAAAAGDRLLRAKGLVRVEEEMLPLLVQCVGTTFSPIRPIAVDTAQSFLVVITRGFTMAELRDVQPPLPMKMKNTAHMQGSLGRKLDRVLDEARVQGLSNRPATASNA